MSLKLTHSVFVAFVRANVSGTTAVSVDLDSDMDGKGKMNVTGNPYAGKGLIKQETLSGLIGYKYANSVNNLAEKEGKEARKAKPHPWGDMDPHSLFRIHRTNNNHYLSMKVQSATVHGYFLPDGTEVPKEALTPFLPVKGKSSTQADLDGEVIARDFSLVNIKTIRMLGQTLELIPDANLEQITAGKAVTASINRIVETV